MTAFFYLFFIADFFWCLRRSRFVVGARENGLGARPNFLYAGKTLYDHVTLKAEIYFYDSVTAWSRSCLYGLVYIYGSPTGVGEKMADPTFVDLFLLSFFS